MNELELSKGIPSDIDLTMDSIFQNGAKKGAALSKKYRKKSKAFLKLLKKSSKVLTLQKSLQLRPLVRLQQ